MDILSIMCRIGSGCEVTTTGRTGIEGNEKMDLLAKEGLDKEIGWRVELRGLIKERLIKEWQAGSECTGKFKIMTRKQDLHLH